MQNKNIIFLTEKQVIELHEEQIALFGGKPGIRDKNLFLSSLGEPQQTFDGKYLYASIYDMASAYLYSFAKNHAFFDGNKRIAFRTFAAFLRINKYDLLFTNDEAEKLILDCVNNNITKAEISKIIEENATDWNMD